MYYPQQPAYYGSQYSGCLKFVLYVASFFIPLVGLIAGVIFISRPDPESKRLGQTLLVLGVISILLSCCLGIGIPLVFIPFLEESTYYALPPL
jgi:hypothetical protein